jgi:hypothetical protein
MDAFEDGEVSKHPNFCKYFSKQTKKTTTTRDREIVIKERDSTRRFWKNATFSFLLDKFEKRYRVSSKNPIKKQNWEDFVAVVNSHFPSDVQNTSGYCIQQSKGQVQCGDKKNSCHKCSTFRLTMLRKI